MGAWGWMVYHWDRWHAAADHIAHVDAVDAALRAAYAERDEAREFQARAEAEAVVLRAFINREAVPGVGYRLAAFRVEAAAYAGQQEKAGRKRIPGLLASKGRTTLD